MLPTETGLRRRILLATALVIVFPFAFIYAFEASVNHVLLPLLESLGDGPSDWRLDVNPVWAAVLVSTGFAAQAVFGPATILRDIGASPVLDQWRPEVQATVARLAQQVDLEPPDLAVVTSEAPNAAAVSGPLGEYVVVT